HLDDADVDALLEQVSGEAVPQGIQRDAIVDLRHLGGGVTGTIELARGHRLRRIAAGEQPAPRPRRLPPGSQQVEQVWREHDAMVLAAFALLDVDDHALAVDVEEMANDESLDSNRPIQVRWPNPDLRACPFLRRWWGTSRHQFHNSTESDCLDL